MEKRPPALEVCDITKQFPGVLANDKVCFSLEHGEIHVLLGENGAGKSTLLNIIYGLYEPDAGDVLIDGEKVQINGPHDAIAHGIGMVHQHFMLVEPFTIAENIMLGSEVVLDLPKFKLHPSEQKTWLDWVLFVLVGIPVGWIWNNFIVGMLRLNKAIRQIEKLSKEFGLEVNPRAVIEDIPVGVQQRVEILKALYRKANILILDEPTAVLTPQEVDDLFEIMHQLTRRGVSIIFITHKLKEVIAVADRVTVMRRGKVVGITTPKEATEQDLATMMVGREVILSVDKGPASPKEIALEIRDVTVVDPIQRIDCVTSIDLLLREGEILGIAGVQGNGQTELVEVVTGLRSPDNGQILIKGQLMPAKQPRKLVECGMAHVPEDRHKHGLVLPYSLADNLILCTYYQPPFANGITRNDEKILENAEKYIKQFDVRAPSPLVPAATLSGGNQQKLIVAREFSREVKVLVANQPTRGLDVGSIEYIHEQIIQMRDNGAAVLLVSAELDEIMSLSDRIAVMHRGEIVDILDAKDATREGLGLLMTGSREGEQAQVLVN